MAFFQRKKYKQLTDAELVNLLRENNNIQRDIIGELYERYGHLVMGTSMKYLKNVMDAEDITMNIFETLENKIKAHEIKYFKSWLYMVTKNSCLMVLRKKDVSTIELNGNEILEEEESEIVKREAMLEALERVIEDLQEPQQTCIKLFYLDQLSYQEISQKLNIELKKVKSSIQNGKRNIMLRIKGNDE